MMRYAVRVRDLRVHTYVVEAESEDEAEKRFEAGDGDLDETAQIDYGIDAVEPAE
jgi:hypothetical protein